VQGSIERPDDYQYGAWRVDQPYVGNSLAELLRGDFADVSDSKLAERLLAQSNEELENHIDARTPIPHYRTKYLPSP